MKIQTDKSPLRPRGNLEVPGDKSISHRALFVAAMATGTSSITGLNRGSDVARTARLIESLGARVAGRAEPQVQVEGYGVSGPKEPDDVLYAGNSGTTLRVALGLCAAVRGLSVLTGDPSLRRRPMARVVRPLREMGASIDGRAKGDLPPLTVRGGDLVATVAELDVASAQTKTALLLGGSRAVGTTVVKEPRRTRDHTERMLEVAGIPLFRSGLAVAVTGPAEPEPVGLRIPGDLSSAMFLIAAALLVPGSDLTIARLGLNPTRTAALDALVRMGARMEWELTDEWSGEPVGSLRVRHSELQAATVGGDEIPQLIDEVPVLAVLASQAQGSTVVRDAHELRVKESNRIEAVVLGLRALGGDAESLTDGLVVRGPTPLTGGAVDSRRDHRVALAFAVAALAAKEPVDISDWSCVDASFPEYLGLLQKAQKAT